MNRPSTLWRSFDREERWAIVACALVLLLCAGMQHARPTSEPPTVFIDAPATGSARPEARAGSPAARSMLRVHVVGAVRRPGVYSLPSGARALDVIKSAGGASARADINKLNLAAHLQDGAQIIVPVSGSDAQLSRVVSPGAPYNRQQLTAGASTRDRGSQTKSVNVNTASIEELEALPGVGPAIAERIKRYREENGRFQSLQDLDGVKGLGAKKLQKLRPYVVF